ncbi:hypothetical protein H8E88_21575 [candidate division KSB1 bacterium]|nr:hypothetical protein [candidate division KSB1 bacterium]MBL7094519.1 hypothetical protein [candidate division KSB1 bacterium]
MIKLKHKKYLNLFILFLFSPILISAQSIEIYDISPDQVESKAFHLEKRGAIQIKAFVGGNKSKNELLSNCWILDFGSREVVWEFSKAKAKKSRSRRILTLEETIRLPKGRYQVFYALNPQRNIVGKKIIGFFFDRESRKYYSPEWGITVQPASKSGRSFLVQERELEEKKAVVQLTEIYDDEYHKKGFTLTAPVKLRIYSIGEGTKSGRQMSDFGWITNVETRERVWEMKYRKTEHAGGAPKNRKFEGRLMLPPGDYMVHYVTDDSHSNEHWNQMPPYNPDFWGITIWADDFKRDHAEIKPLERGEFKPIIELTRMRNNRYERQGFQLLKEAKVHIFVLGESSHSRRSLADYGWIVDASTRETVWKMEYRNTEYAGGGKKNRVFDGFVTLPKGKYFACYRTDDSHAYRSWNVDAPWMPESWGITIACANKTNKKNIQLFDERDDVDILVRLTRVHDDEKISQRFELTKTTHVRIYAIGEGRSGKMFDYGWIEDDEGEKVWKMEYYDTEHAGGGTKNRVANQVIKLKRGTYRVYFKTDDSHSYRDWNTTPPDDGEHWGITVILVSG